jgi:hypothetical protein
MLILFLVATSLVTGLIASYIWICKLCLLASDEYKASAGLDRYKDFSTLKKVLLITCLFIITIYGLVGIVLLVFILCCRN